VGLAVKHNNKNLFKGRQFTAEIILWAVRWYLQFPISYRDLERMFSDRGIQVDHTTLFRWIQAYAPELEKRIRPHLRMTSGSWRVDETYIRVKGEWVYLYRAVDATGQTIDFLLSPKRVRRPPDGSSARLWDSRIRSIRGPSRSTRMQPILLR
jgi:transposase-like protein